MSQTLKPTGSIWRSLFAGLMVGAASGVLLAAEVIGLTLLFEAHMALLLSLVLGDVGIILLLIACLAGVLLMHAVAFWVVRRWLLPFFRKPGRGPLEWTATASGMLLALAIVVVLMPVSVRDAAVRLATGESIASRAALPASESQRRRLQERVRPAAEAGDPAAQVELGLALLRGAAGEPRDGASAAAWIDRAATHPNGFEARMLLAVDAIAGPIEREGRIQTADDRVAKVERLQRIAPTLPAEWQPALLGTVGGIQIAHYGGDTPDDQDMRDAMFAAGRAGSRAFAALAAAYDEAYALYLQGGHPELADAAWRRAFEGYAGAGATFEIARLRDDALPERLGALAVPMPGAGASAPDTALAQRLWRFALALDGDDVHERATPGQRDLAAAVSLLAMERAPDAAQIAAQNPAARWAANSWAFGRWVMALRHARGDCGAAFALSEATRQRRRPATVSGRTPPASSLDMAWSRAWAEAGGRCAASDEERRLAQERISQVDYITLSAGELEAARAGVVATVDALR